MRPGKVEVKKFEEAGVLGHDFKDVLASVGLVAETFFEFAKDLLVVSVV